MFQIVILIRNPIGKVHDSHLGQPKGQGPGSRYRLSRMPSKRSSVLEHGLRKVTLISLFDEKSACGVGKGIMKDIGIYHGHCMG